MNELTGLRDHRNSLSKYLGLVQNADVESILEESLWGPLEDFLSKPGKNIRPKLVELGFRLASRNEAEIDLSLVQEKLNIASSIVEAIHAGALIIDDIEDGSEVRRNAPSLHLKYGLPKALNAGNWLYFWGLEKIPLLGLSDKAQSRLTEECLRYLTCAHMGQAIDLGTVIDKIPQIEVRDICLASMELKTGTLLALALRLGAAVGGLHEGFEKLDLLGRRLGILLQIFDDIGNFSQQKTEGLTKRQEDLKLKRPSWIWAIASSGYREDSYQEFKKAVSAIPSEDLLNEWMEKNDFRNQLMKSTKYELDSFLSDCEEEWGITHKESAKTIFEIGKILERAYV